MTLAALAQLIGARLDGPGDLDIARPVPAGQGGAHTITFAENDKFLMLALSADVSAVVVQEGATVDRPALFVPQPRVAFGMVLQAFARPWPLEPGVHSTAVIHPSAEVADSARIGAFVVVSAGAVIGEDAQVHPHAYIGEGCVVGARSVIGPRVVLVQDVRLGAECLIHAGAVLGADGFGFAWTGERQAKIAQVGGVVLGDRVEVGANTCIDRATCGDTVIADGVKLDNLIQIGHNVKVGEHTVIAALAGIAGSSTVGARNTMGGQVAFSDHVSTGDDVILAGRSGVTKDISEPGAYWGTPPLPLREALLVAKLQQSLPELVKRVKELERQVDALRGQSDA